MTKVKLLLIILLAVSISVPAIAQDWSKQRGPNWVYDSVFADSLATGEKLAWGGHGITVDKYDRVWITSYYAAETGGIWVLNADGTPTTFSPIAQAVFADTTFDFAVANGSRGTAVDHEGNILHAFGSTLIKLNVEDGSPMAYWQAGTSLLKPAVDAEGYIYMGAVVGVSPINVLDPATFEVTQQITLDPAPSYARGLEVSPDGKTLIPGNLDGGGAPIYIYTSEDYVTYTLTDSIAKAGPCADIFKYQCPTMDWGPEGKLWISHDDSYAGRGRTENGFVVVDMDAREFSYLFMPMDSTENNGPRGIAFNAAGDVAYAVSFTANKVYKFTKAELQTPGDWTFDDGLTDWEYAGVFADSLATGEKLAWGGHGITVDKYDRVWSTSYYAAETGGIWVLNADGTPTTFSPIAQAVFADTTFDFAVANGSRGTAVDHEGNILHAFGSTLIKLNVEDGSPMAYWQAGTSLLKPAVDAEGYIYMGVVVGVNPVSVLDPATFEVTQQITLDNAPSYARGMEVSPDGKTLIPGNLDGGGAPIYIYTSEDYVTYTLTDSMKIDDRGYPMFLFQCPTMDWGPEGNLWISHDDSYAGRGRVYNGFAIADLATRTYDYLTVPMDSTENNGPRGVAFNADGNVAYATSFTANKIWKFTKRGPCSVKLCLKPDVPTEFKLGHNYPNPFNPTTIIPFSLVKSGNVEIKVFDILGREVKTLISEPMSAGVYKVNFDATGLATGIYHYRIKFNGTMQTKRMLLIK